MGASKPFCSVQVVFLHVLSRLWCHLQLKPLTSASSHSRVYWKCASTTGNFNIITLDRLLKSNAIVGAIVGNTGRFGNGIDLAGSAGLDGMKVDNNKPQKSVSLCDRPATGHRDVVFLQEQGAAASLSVEVLDGNHRLQERSPALLG